MIRLADTQPAPKLTIRRVLVALAISAAIILSAGKADPQGATSSPLGGCAEDMPCWDCHTMGNRICGPTNDLNNTPSESENQR